MTIIENVSRDFSDYQQKIVNNLGYFAMARTRIRKVKTNEYVPENVSLTAEIIYWIFYVNTFVKAVFLAFLVMDFFGPVVFLDKIAALDYILCVGIVTFGSCIWFLRYPLNEILYGFWKIENSIFNLLGRPEDIKAKVDKLHHSTVWIHLGIVWFGCLFLVTQFYADPKYCAFTYSMFEADNWYLRIIFCLHEFFFMMHPWNNMTGSSSLCTFEGIALSNIIDGMTHALESLRHQEIVKEATSKTKGILKSNDAGFARNLHRKRDLKMRASQSSYDIDKLLFDYKQLMIISDQFNAWVSYKIVFLHACGYCQFISDVFVAMQVLKIPGAGIQDVWFYIEDSLASMYMIYRVYKLASHVSPSSTNFLRSLDVYLCLNSLVGSERKRLSKISKTLRIVALKLGPCPITPQTVLTALDMLGNYYVCVALWK